MHASPATLLATNFHTPRSRQLLADALNFPMPVKAVEKGVFALELFHGPTFAFKDVGARVMARLMSPFTRRASR